MRPTPPPYSTPFSEKKLFFFIYLFIDSGNLASDKSMKIVPLIWKEQGTYKNIHFISISNLHLHRLKIWRQKTNSFPVKLIINKI